MGQLEGYTLGETVYEGPETRIRRATCPSAAEPLVVKLPVAAAPSLRIVGRLIHEHQILEKLAPLPGVVRTRGLVQADGSAALILEDPGLRSLDRVLAERGRLDLGAALQVAHALCRVLEGVHAAGVMHKDLKPHAVAPREPPPHSIRSGAWACSTGANLPYDAAC
jgi:serine/threonine protein kinase